jgi:hypothetical protein
MSRIFGFVGVVISLAIGMYIYSVQVRGLSAAGGNGSVAGAAEIAGVRSDLIGIASAERAYFAAQGSYATLDELRAGKYITMAGERPPYSYDTNFTPSGFQVTATRDTRGGPAAIWIDETMQIKSSE